MISKKFVFTLLVLSSSLQAMNQDTCSNNSTSTSEWMQEATKRNLSHPVLLRFVYASRNPGASQFQRMIVIHDKVWGLVGPQSFNHYDEPYMDMERVESAEQSKVSRIIIRAPNQQVYFVNFERVTSDAQASPLFKVILEKIKDTSAHNQSLQAANHEKVREHLQDYQTRYMQIAKEHVDTLEGVSKGNILTILADDLSVYLSKGNK